jgi:hypothetical protein
MWAKLEPKAQDICIFFQEEFIHEMEQALNHLYNLSKLDGINRLPDYRLKSIVSDTAHPGASIRDATPPSAACANRSHFRTVVRLLAEDHAAARAHPIAGRDRSGEPRLPGGCICASILHYVIYVCFFFLFAFDSLGVGEAWTVEKYESFVDSLSVTQPQMAFNDSLNDCDSDIVAITAISSTDASVFPNITDLFDELRALFPDVTVSIEWDINPIRLLDEARNVIQDYLMTQNRQVLIGYRDRIAGLEDNIMITADAIMITVDGEVPWEFRRGAGIVAGIFWSGLYHASRISAIPHVQAQVIRNSARTDKRLTCDSVS